MTMTDRQREACVAWLAEAIPHALNGNASWVIAHLQGVMDVLHLDDLDVAENAYAAARRGEAKTPDP